MSKTSNYLYFNADLEGVGVEGVGRALGPTDDKVESGCWRLILGWHHSDPHVAIAAAA